MAKVAYRKATSDRQDLAPEDFGDKIFILRFGGFTRTREGGLVIKDQEFRGESRRKLYWQVEIVWPPELRGQSPGLSTTLKGIALSRSSPEVSQEDTVDFTLEGEWTPYMLKRAEDFGFDLHKIDPDDPLHDPAYLESAFETLTFPLSIEQILERVLEPKMLEADQWARASCIEGTTWVDSKTMSPLSPDEQAQLEKRIKELEQLPLDSPAPVPTLNQRAREQLLTGIGRLVADGNCNPRDVLSLIETRGWDVDLGQPLLGQLTIEQLQVVFETFSSEPIQEDDSEIPF